MNLQLLWRVFVRAICQETNMYAFANDNHKRYGYFLLECIIGLMITSIVIGSVFAISVRLSQECKIINQSAGSMYGLLNICDAFEEDVRRGGPLKIIRATNREITLDVGFETISWKLSSTDLRRTSAQKKTFVSRGIASISLHQTRDGYEFMLSDISGNRAKRYIKVIA